MQTLQIQLTDELLEKVDEIVKKGLFHSRSQLLQEALLKYLSKLSHIGSLPFIVGPFTPEEMELLKMNPQDSLEIPSQELESINKELKKFLM